MNLLMELIRGLLLTSYTFLRSRVYLAALVSDVWQTLSRPFLKECPSSLTVSFLSAPRLLGISCFQAYLIFLNIQYHISFSIRVQ